MAVLAANKAAFNLVNEIQGRFKQKELWQKGRTAGRHYDEGSREALDKAQMEGKDKSKSIFICFILFLKISLQNFFRKCFRLSLI